MAAEKAAAAHTEGHFTLAADTVVAVGSRILPKAETPTQIRACLTLLSGRRHHVITAITLIDPAGHISHRTVDTAVIMARLSRDQLDSYISDEEGLGKAGGYAIQGRAAAFIRQIGGSYSAVVGLPLFETAQLLRGRGYPVP